MNEFDPYQYVADMGMAQRRAGVDKHVRELVCSYARLQADEKKRPVFFQERPVWNAIMEHAEVRMIYERDRTIDVRFLDFLARYAAAMKQKGLPPLFDTQQLADYLGIGMKQLVHLTHNQNLYYKRFSIPKKNGGSRSIDAPKYALKTLQRKILWKILEQADPGEAATAFVRKVSIRDNAERHAGKGCVIRIDLKDFFPSVSHKRIRRVFERLGYPYSVAQALANICSLKGFLPQGAPTSPTLSNLICKTMDKRYGQLSEKLDFTYSRYADDLVFSSNDRNFARLIPLFREIVRSEGFVVNEKKLSIMKKGNRQMVTGMVVNEKPNVPKEHLRLLRAAAHRYKPEGGKPVELPSRKKGADSVNVLQGRISFVHMVCPARARQLRNIKDS